MSDSINITYEVILDIQLAVLPAGSDGDLRPQVTSPIPDLPRLCVSCQHVQIVVVMNAARIVIALDQDSSKSMVSSLKDKQN